MPYSIFILFMLGIGFINSCKSVSQIQIGTDLLIASAFLQKIIPGEEELREKTILHIYFENYNMETCKIDSVYYLHKVYPMNESKLNYEIVVDSGKPTMDKLFVRSGGDVATVFYHKQSTSFYMKIEDIKSKNTLYMP